MKIVNVNVHKHDMQLKAPWAIAGRVTESVQNIFVEIQVNQDIKGIGSGAPSPDVTGENFTAAYNKLQSMAEKMIGWDTDDEDHFLEKLQSDLKDFPAVRAAIDMALFDLLAKSEKTSLIERLGQVHQSFPTSITIGVASLEQTIKDAKNHLQEGFNILKLKIGENVDEDIEKVFALSELSSEGPLIRVDANQGYSIADLEKFYDETRHLGLELVEQPLPRNQIKEMLNFPEELRDICVADESLHSPADAIKLTDKMRPFGVFNIKLMKCGGIYPALKIAKIAQNEGIKLMWGCMDESKISIAAALHAALASSATEYLDLDGHFDLKWDLVSGGYNCKNGVMTTNNKPGLGVYNEL